MINDTWVYLLSMSLKYLEELMAQFQGAHCDNRRVWVMLPIEEMCTSGAMVQLSWLVVASLDGLLCPNIFQISQS